ncbi:MAG: hypothetical protein D6812_01000, partial [Deltaproteobacteria bacterium]
MRNSKKSFPLYTGNPPFSRDFPVWLPFCFLSMMAARSAGSDQKGADAPDPKSGGTLRRLRIMLSRWRNDVMRRNESDPKSFLWMWLASLIVLLSLNACGREKSETPQERQEGQTEFISAAGGDSGTRDQPLAGAGDAEEGGDDAQREIEEADLVRIEGDTLYALNPYRGLFVIDVTNPDAPTIVGRARIYGVPVEMYFRDAFAYVVVSDYISYGGPEVAIDTAEFSPFQGSEVVIVDLTDRRNPGIVGRIAVEGYISDSRIVGDILYLVTNTWQCPSCTDIPGEISDNGPYTAVLSYEITGEGTLRAVDALEFPGNAFQIHVTTEAIFVAATDWQGEEETGVQTLLSYVDISDPQGTIALRDTVTVPGYVTDRFKLDAYGETFRIVTHSWDGGGISRLYVLDIHDPDRIETLSNIALGEGEQLFATRFDGPRAYLVTYYRVDPLFVIDLSDPSAPQIAGELEVPGWSVHIEPRGDRLIALGIDDTDGRRVSVSLFDVADPEAPALLSRVTFGEGYSSSSAFNDVKAFRVVDEMGLILLPYSAYTFEEGETGEGEEGREKFTNGLQLIDFTEEALVARGHVEQTGEIQRAFPHKGRLISLSPQELLVIDPTDRDHPVVTDEMELVRNVEDFAVVAGRGVEIATEQNFTEGARVLVVPADDPDVGEPLGGLGIDTVDNRVFTNGDFLYVVGRLPDTWASKVNVIDLSSPEAPVLRGSFLLPDDVQLGYGYNYWYGTGDDVVQIDGR